MVALEAGFVRSAARLAGGRGTGLLLAVATAGCLRMALGGADQGSGVAVMAAIFVAASVSSIAGFAFSAVAGAMLFHLIDDPVRVVALMITCSIANQSAMVWSFRKNIDWIGLRPFCLSGAIGLPIGIWILLHADRVLYTHLLGGFLLAYGGFMLVRKAIVIRKPRPGGDIAVGFLGGITGAAAGFPSAFISIWCGMKGWDKARQRAVVQPFVLVMQIASFVAISVLQGAHGADAGFRASDLMFLPASLLGTSCGMALYGRLTDVQFGRAVNLLLIVSGLSYVV